jgi:hypothetical protein
MPGFKKMACANCALHLERYSSTTASCARMRCSPTTPRFESFSLLEEYHVKGWTADGVDLPFMYLPDPDEDTVKSARSP